MVEAYVPTAEEEAQFKKERDAFIQITYGHIARTGTDKTALTDDAIQDNM